jgi:hypothetical protein
MKMIEAIMQDDTAGDPMSSLKWSRKSTDKISQELRSQNIVISPRTTAKLLEEMDYSLKANRKTIAETHHADRNRQFEIIADQKKDFANMGLPMVSIDSKKKELIGNFKNAGRTWNKTAEEVLVHDFPSMAIGKVTPNGLYDLKANNGTVVLGTSHDTPEFAVETIELWLTSRGLFQYPNMPKLLILCDAGGSNGYRSRAWKYYLYHKISKPYEIILRICHYPPGASKWNPIEHRLFSFISINWAGVPLRSYDIMLNLIQNTTTQTGLVVDAVLNEKVYETGIKIKDDQMAGINIIKHSELPEWNYTIYP